MTEDERKDGFADLNVSNHLPVAQVIEFLRGFPSDWVVTAYEGEGGQWIQLRNPHR